jgi:hypothetical protein
MRYPQVAGNLENINMSLCLGMATLSVGAYLWVRDSSRSQSGSTGTVEPIFSSSETVHLKELFLFNL